jgi:hypothetical protein
MRSLIGVVVALCCACSGSGSGGTGGGSATGGGSSTGGGSGTGGGSASGAGPAGSTFIPFTSDTESQDLAVDSSGAVHIVAEVNASATNNVLYAYCASGCDKASGYTVTAIDSISAPNDEVVLRLTASGHPRILQPGTANGHNGFDILSCDSSCTSAASWTRTRALDDDGRIDLAVEHDYFAVGPAGQLAFIYSSGDGMHLVQCNPTCTNVTLTNGISWGQVQLRIDSAGTLHTAFVDLSDPAAYKAVYLQCSTGCATLSNWGGAQFSSTNQSPKMSLVLDGTKPRVAAWYETVGDMSFDQKLYFDTCDTGCTMPASWHGTVLAWPDTMSSGPGRRVKLALSGAGDVAVVSRSLDTLVVGSCSGPACMTPSGKWSAGAVNSSAAMAVAFPTLMPCELGSWFFEYGLGAEFNAQNHLVLAYGAHARADVGNSESICAEGFNYDYQTVVQDIP